MLSKITGGLTKEKADEVTSSFKQAHAFRERLTSLLERDIKDLEDKLYSDNLFVSHDWENEVKNIVANIRAYKNTIKYLK